MVQEEIDMTKTNIKGLPEGEYFTSYGYSDSHAWKVISRTEKTITLASVEVDNDPEWIAKREFHPGGFFGHTSNQNEQTWIFKAIGQARHVIRMTKKGWSYKGEMYSEGIARHFYDYNF